MNRRFPIQSEHYDPKCRWGSPHSCPNNEEFRVPFPRTIPWADAEKAYKTYSRRYGTSQSLERLAERAGFGGYEFVQYFYDIKDNSDFWDYCVEYMGAYKELLERNESKNVKNS